MDADLDIAVDHVSVVIGGHALLHPTSLSLCAGRITALIGRNGAGKSTLLSVISGIRRPTCGSVRYGNHDLAACATTQLALMRAYLPQDASVAFDYRVHDIVELGRLAHVRQPTCRNDAHAIRHALGSFELTDLAHRNVKTLSGGERQRVRMARLAAQLYERIDQRQPAWLLLDEPTAALDIDQQHRLMARLRAYADQGCGVLLILHDLALAALYADAVIVIENGKIVEHGAAATVLSPGVIQYRFGIDVGAVAMSERGHSLYPHPRRAA
ncbi:MAG: ATP-binding cassette domain-containing protein [Hyphomicrobiales bacterium]|nr:ATP-binding cassette domain-containing protein [Hyphomicrobiales bacterium]